MYCDNGLSAYLGYQVSEEHEKEGSQRRGQGFRSQRGLNSIQGQRLRFILYPMESTDTSSGGHGAIPSSSALCARPRAIQCNPLIPL